MNTFLSPVDRRFMAAAIRLARRHQGRTGTNPAVACVLVSVDDPATIIGSGVTAVGGRPHAEPIALAEAGASARGATAYVTLEPCAHHASTPPCAETLINAGIARVVTAVTDPDPRVDDKGHAMLREAGIAVAAGCLGETAAIGLAAYLNRKVKNRAHVTLKLAVSADGYLGVSGGGQVAITGPAARRQGHLMRARHHAILVGAGTVIEDDPALTCRLPGMAERSPTRIVLDPNARVPLGAKIFAGRSPRTLLAAPATLDAARRAALVEKGVEIVTCEMTDDRVALAELLEDLAAGGVMSVMVEGGAAVAAAFLAADLVDEIALFEGALSLAGKAETRRLVRSPLQPDALPEGFHLTERLSLGEDRLTTYLKPVS